MSYINTPKPKSLNKRYSEILFMPNISLTLPDGSKKEFKKGITGKEIAESVGKRLLADAIAIKVDEEVLSLDEKIEKDSKIKILTFSDSEGIHAFRHSTCHVLADAVKKLYSKSKNTIGPPVEEGFYYDFDDLPISSEDFPKIEAEMKKIVAQDLKFVRKPTTVAEVKKLFKENPYKIELAEEFAKQGKKLTLVYHGDYVDLCGAPHVSSTGMLKAFKLFKVAGAYWRGDSKNKQLTRIYGISFPAQKQLDEHVKMLEEAEKRDHRKIGREQDLFFFSELVGSGLPLWTPKGTLLRNLLDEFVWELRKQKGHTKVTIPHITKKELYITSGHWAKYADDLFKIKTRDGHEFAMKPMNCPHHTQIFSHVIRSYRDLPQRYAETTMVYRDEQTGELSGLSRVLCITQDDDHVFCRESQLKKEALDLWDMLDIFYGTFGFKLKIRLSLHDPLKFEKYVGSPEQWKFAEDQLREFVKEKKAEAVEVIGEAAFYGPKLDFMAQDSLGRKWQVATIQIDRNMPKSFDLYCINEKGEHERIVMIHAAIMGSIERFTSVLIEHCAGKFPLWLAPVQARIMTISEKSIKYGEKVKEVLKQNDIRVELDVSSDTINKKVRDAQLMKIPLMLTVGEKEEANGTLAVRMLNGDVLFGVKLEDFVSQAKELITKKSLEIKLNKFS